MCRFFFDWQNGSMAHSAKYLMSKAHSSLQRMRLSARALVLLLGLATGSHAFAWGSEGHQVIALIAQSQLTPSARAEVERLLASEPGATLATISTWADEHRNPATAPWHYVNFPRDSCNYNPERDCPDGRCVVDAIDKQSRILKFDVNPETQLRALKYVVHFVGDIHQPLHAGFGDDRGGNTYQLQAFMRGTNLHALWDGVMIRSFNESPQAISERLLKVPNTGVNVPWTPPQAAQESCQIVSMPGYYPERQVGMDYVEKFKPTLEKRLLQAGTRLAQTLNAIWK